MQANIVIVGATRGFETLTYSIPPTLDGLIQPGHRVLAPLRARKVTGVVTEVGERLSSSELSPFSKCSSRARCSIARICN